MKIVPCSARVLPSWVELRHDLWPDTTHEMHLVEARQQLLEPTRYAQFLAENRGTTIGFVEASMRQDHVTGTKTSPVAYLGGLYVTPDARRKGAARALVDAVLVWARKNGATELASDVELANLLGQRVHRELDFHETERVVFYRRVIG